MDRPNTPPRTTRSSVARTLPQSPPTPEVTKRIVSPLKIPIYPNLTKPPRKNPVSKQKQSAINGKPTSEQKAKPQPSTKPPAVSSSTTPENVPTTPYPETTSPKPNEMPETMEQLENPAMQEPEAQKQMRVSKLRGSSLNMSSMIFPR